MRRGLLRAECVSTDPSVAPGRYTLIGTYSIVLGGKSKPADRTVTFNVFRKN